jgi:hypothetical protein
MFSKTVKIISCNEKHIIDSDEDVYFSKIDDVSKYKVITLKQIFVLYKNICL